MTTDSPTPHAVPAFPWKLLFRPFVWLALAIPPLALAVELGTHACMNLLIDPIPSWGHVALIALVPIAIFRARYALAKEQGQRARIDAALLATACGTSLAYCIGMFPILALACMASVYLPLIAVYVLMEGGMGGEAPELLRVLPLIPLAFAPVVGLLTTAFHGWRVGRGRPGAARRFGAFFLLGLGLFALVELPGAAAHYGLSSRVPDVEALAPLRTLATKNAMLRAVRFGPHNAYVSGWVVSSSMGPVADYAAPERYFRVTGEGLHEAPPLRLTGASTTAGSWLDTIRFDEMQGGDRVGRGLGDVHQVGSKLEGELHAEGEFGYLEWTLTFRNDGARPREARALVALPDGGVVSRTTLWVNGEEREGSVATKAATRAAYEGVVRQQRDPLLVTASHVGEVLVQCFPIPPNGGEMKIRLGITAPLLPHGTDALALPFPRFVERNFELGESLETEVSLRSPSGDVTWGDRAAWVTRVAAPASIWVADARGPAESAIRQTWQESRSTRELLVVVDGSQRVGAHVSEIVAGLDVLSRELPLEILLAADEPEWLGSEPAALRHASFQYGQANAPALSLAVERMRERTEGERSPAVLWIHGPRPVALEGTYALEQLLDGEAPGPIFHFGLEPGSNRLWSHLEQQVAPGSNAGADLLSIARIGSVEDDLRAFGSALRSGTALQRASRERVAPPPRIASSVREPTSRAAVHITRLWAWEESRRLGRSHAHIDAAASAARANAVAARYELVTPWSGAVVLETDAEYTAASLPIPRRNPDDPTLTDPPAGPHRAEWADAPAMPPPPIPEPGGALLFAVGTAVVALSRRRRPPR